MIVVVYTLQNEKVLRFFVRGELSLPMTETDLQASLWQTAFVVKFNFVSCVFKEFFINSLFCRYRVYQDNSQILTLYKFKNHQTFNWQYTKDVRDQPLLILTGFGGDWQMIGNELRLMRGGNQITAMIDDNEIVLGDMEDNELIKNKPLKLK